MTAQQLNEKLISFASEVDELTINQAKETASMPFVWPYVALMPDAHFGKGSAVGTVIPTRGAIIPAAVGVDIGCLDADTEFLSDRGWIRMADWMGDRVMQYDPDTGEGRLAHPSRYIARPAEFFYHLRSKYGVNQMLTPDHRMLVWEIRGRKRERVMRTVLAEEFVANDRRLTLGYKAEFATTFQIADVRRSDGITGLRDGYKAMQSELVRVAVMVAADGHVTRGGNRVVLRFRKQRKIERAQKLLSAAGIAYTINEFEEQGKPTTDMRFPWTRGKDLSWFWHAEAQTLEVLCNEVLYWDGNLKDRIFYTRKREEADLVQYAFTATGRRASITIDHRDSGIDYRVVVSDRVLVGLTGQDRLPIVAVPSVDGKAYCFTVPTGYFVARRNGNIFITGNCGMQALRTRFTKADIPQGAKLSDLRESLESAIPLSPGNYNKSLKRYSFTHHRLNELQADAQRDRINLDHSPKWMQQLGSLGGGNHFIELCTDQDDTLWLILHSGSRGVGNKIAQKWIKVAESYCKEARENVQLRGMTGDYYKLPNRDLAFLDEGTAEFDGYITELRWAQKFALYNRDEMLDRFKQAFAHWMGVEAQRVEIDRVKCHHNYTVQEVIDGKSVWLTRKGAVDANEGVRAMIPGSMGTPTYVVTGLGNPKGLLSAPHGAGRRFSRKKAKEQFTEQDLANRMEGIEYRPGAQFVDEIPDAYKPIDLVMADAADLVQIDYKLNQLLNVKGN